MKLRRVTTGSPLSATEQGPQPLTREWYRWLPLEQLRELADDAYPDNMIYVRARAELDRRASAGLKLVEEPVGRPSLSRKPAHGIGPGC